MIPIGEIQKLTRILSISSKNNQFLRKYSSCIGISKRMGYYNSSRDLYKIKINSSGAHYERATASSENYESASFISFEQMNTLRWITRYLQDLEYNTSRGSSNSSVKYPNMFLVYPSDMTNSYGVNVQKDIKIRGNLYNLLKFKNEILSENNYGTMHLPAVHTIFWVGKNYNFLGLMTSAGKLLFRYETVRNIMSNNTEDECAQLFTTLFKYIDRFQNVQNSLLIKDISPILSEQLFRETMSILSSSRLKFSKNNSEIDIDKLTSTVQMVAKTAVDKRLNKTVFGACCDYSYTRLVRNILKNQENMTRSLVHNAFQEGMKLALKLEMIGWSLNNKIEFTDSRHGDVWWEKEVNIVPDSFIKNNKRYQIPEKYRKWKITKLYVSQHGKMRCDGNHPNVSRSKVCTGDLKIEWENGDDALKDSLLRAEGLLEIINYDSAYNYNDQQILLNHGILLDIYDENKVSKMRKAVPSIRRFGELSTEEDDPDIEPPEDIRPEITEVTNDSGEVIGAIIEEYRSPDQIREDERLLNRSRRYNDNDEEEEENGSIDYPDQHTLITSTDSYDGTPVQVISNSPDVTTNIVHVLTEEELNTTILEIQATGLMLSDDDIQ